MAHLGLVVKTLWIIIIIIKWEMLTGVLRALVNNPVKESFYKKRKKKTINVLTAFFISHKSDVKTFLKWIVSITLIKFMINTY